MTANLPLPNLYNIRASCPITPSPESPIDLYLLANVLWNVTYTSRQAKRMATLCLHTRGACDVYVHQNKTMTLNGGSDVRACVEALEGANRRVCLGLARMERKRTREQANELAKSVASVESHVAIDSLHVSYNINNNNNDSPPSRCSLSSVHDKIVDAAGPSATLSMDVHHVLYPKIVLTSVRYATGTRDAASLNVTATFTDAHQSHSATFLLRVFATTTVIAVLTSDVAPGQVGSLMEALTLGVHQFLNLFVYPCRK